MVALLAGIIAGSDSEEQRNSQARRSAPGPFLLGRARGAHDNREAMRRNASVLAEIVDATMDGVVGADHALNVVLFNRAAEQLFGVSESDVLGRPLAQFIRADGEPPFEQQVRQLIGALERSTWRLSGLRGLHASGRAFPVEVSLSRSTTGMVFAVSIRDLSERDRAEDAARDASELFATAFRASPASMIISTLEGRFVAANEAFGRLVGIPVEEIVGNTSMALWPSTSALPPLVEVLRRDGLVRGVELEMASPAGSRHLVVSFERIELGHEPHVFGVLVDVTEHRKAAELLGTAFRSSPAGMSISTLEGDLLEVNETLARCLGYSREELIGKNTLSIGLWAHAKEREAVIARLMKDGEALGFEVSLNRKTGEPARMLCSWVQIKVGERTHIFSVTQDLSKQLADEARLRASERRQAFTFNASPAAMVLVRVADGRLLELNDAACRLLEVSREQAIGRTMVELGFYSAQTRADVYELVQRTGRIIGHEARMSTHTGKPVDVQLSAEIIELDGAPHLLASILDVSARKRAEAAARENERRFLQVAENMREVFWLADIETAQVLYVSPAYERITGHSREELYADTSRFLSMVHVEDKERLGEALKTQPDGRSELDFRIIRPDGTVRFLHNVAFLVRNETGKAVRIAGIAEDVTERKSLSDQVRLAQKMESIGQLAGGVAHDFNNLLTVISSSNQYLRAQLGRTEGLFHDLTGEIDQAVSRATALTKQLLAFSRQQIISPVILDLNDVVGETTKMLGRLLGEDVRLVTSLLPGLPEVRVDPGQLSQMLLNLAVNARDAMPKGGTLTIATADITFDERLAKRRLGLKPGRYAELSMTDTGQGMTKEVQAHLFEPFFTTKAAGQGTGLGLAVVFGIVQQAGGHIEVDSAPEQGTSFRIYFPASTQADKLNDEATTTRSLEGHETLLVVEDEDTVRWVAIRGLRARGYEVLEAASAQEAMQLLEEHRDKVALIITDVVMPGIDGRELSIMARRLCPTLPVLFTSGFTDDTVIRHGIQHDQVPFIEKPYSPNALAKKVRQVLDERRVKQPNDDVSRPDP